MDKELFARATLKFSQPLTTAQFRELALFLSRRTGSRISYNTREGAIADRGIEERGSAGVEGMIAKISCGHLATLPFESYRAEVRRDEDYHKFDGIRLILPPGYSSSAIDSRDLATIDQLRTEIVKYKPKK